MWGHRRVCAAAVETYDGGDGDDGDDGGETCGENLRIGACGVFRWRRRGRVRRGAFV